MWWIIAAALVVGFLGRNHWPRFFGFTLAVPAVIIAWKIAFGWFDPWPVYPDSYEEWEAGRGADQEFKKVCYGTSGDIVGCATKSGVGLWNFFIVWPVLCIIEAIHPKNLLVLIVIGMLFYAALTKFHEWVTE